MQEPFWAWFSDSMTLNLAETNNCSSKAARRWLPAAGCAPALQRGGVPGVLPQHLSSCSTECLQCRPGFPNKLLCREGVVLLEKWDLPPLCTERSWKDILLAWPLALNTRSGAFLLRSWCKHQLVYVLTGPLTSRQLSPAEDQRFWLSAIYDCLCNEDWKRVSFYFIVTKR